MQRPLYKLSSSGRGDLLDWSCQLVGPQIFSKVSKFTNITNILQKFQIVQILQIFKLSSLVTFKAHYGVTHGTKGFENVKR